MKIKHIIGAACVAAVISLAPNVEAQLSDNFDAPTVNPGWTVDRYLPQSVSIQNVDGHSALQLGVTAAGYQGAGSFYDYQGVQRSVGGIAGAWTATEQIDVTAQMLSGYANGGFWLRTGNGSDESTADYSIIAFRNPDGNGDANAGFYAWNDVLGIWVATGVSPTLGWHTLTMDYTGSDVISSIDGTTVYDNNALGNPAYDGDVTTVFNEAYNYGDRDYTVSFDNLNVSAVPDGGSTMVLMAIAALPMMFFVSRRRLLATASA